MKQYQQGSVGDGLTRLRQLDPFTTLLTSSEQFDQFMAVLTSSRLACSFRLFPVSESGRSPGRPSNRPGPRARAARESRPGPAPTREEAAAPFSVIILRSAGRGPHNSRSTRPAVRRRAGCLSQASESPPSLPRLEQCAPRCCQALTSGLSLSLSLGQLSRAASPSLSPSRS